MLTNTRAHRDDFNLTDSWASEWVTTTLSSKCLHTVFYIVFIQASRVYQTHFHCSWNWYTHALADRIDVRSVGVINFCRFKREIIWVHQTTNRIVSNRFNTSLSHSFLISGMCVCVCASLRPSQGCIDTLLLMLLFHIHKHTPLVLLSNRQIRHFSSGKSNAAIHLIHFLKYWLWTGPWNEYSVLSFSPSLAHSLTWFR